MNTTIPVNARAGQVGLAVPVQPPSNGSLADAFGALNGEISDIEASMKGLWERVQPFLEPTPPDPATQSEGKRAASPLAEATYELVSRLDVIRRGLDEMKRRISY